MDKPGEKNEIQEISQELLQLYDEFTIYTQSCAFLCDAFSAITASNEELSKESIRGLQHHANKLKYQTIEIKAKLGDIRMLYLSDVYN